MMKIVLKVGQRGVMLLALMTLVVTASVASAAWRAPDSEIDPELLRIDETSVLGKLLDVDIVLVDQDGKEFKFTDYRGMPTVLLLSYYTCDGFCPSFNADLKNSLEAVEALGRVEAGTDFRVVTVSFDENDNAETASSFRKSLGILSPTLEENWRVGVFKDKKDIAKRNGIISINRMLHTKFS